MKRFGAKVFGAQANAVDIVEQILLGAIAEGASDVHIEPLSEGLSVRYRIDGVLFASCSVSAERASQVIMRIKVLAHADIAQQRLPQDGMFSMQTESGSIDIRVATFPGVYGEKVVLRILDRTRSFVQFDALGMPSEQAEQLRFVAQKMSGLVLVTGPTGSGKTTTLYALLELLREKSAQNNTEKNIITLEDPVECVLDGVTQGTVNQAIGFSFDRGIRALVRQDPDIIMVGEIRDAQTARAAVSAALTGHLVISSLHTPDAPRAVIRLLDMGIEPFLVAASVKAIVSQRLVRLLCPVCKKKRALLPQEKKYIKFHAKTCAYVYNSAGCNACVSRGFCGRTGVFETLVFSEALCEFVRQNASLSVLYEQAKKDGWQPLVADAINKISTGLIAPTALYGL